MPAPTLCVAHSVELVERDAGVSSWHLHAERGNEDRIYDVPFFRPCKVNLFAAGLSHATNSTIDPLGFAPRVHANK